MGIFNQAKDLYQLQKKAKAVKSKLKTLQVEAEVDGVVITLTAEQELVDLRIREDRLSPEQKSKLEEDLKKAFNKGMKKAQEVAAEHMKALMGEMGMDMPNL